MNVSIDFETRSTVDLLKCGAPKYAEGESTRVMCLAFKVDDQSTRLWVPEEFIYMISEKFRQYIIDNSLWISENEIKYYIQQTNTITAHNIQFEYHIWMNQMVKLGFPMIDINKLRCSAAKAANFALPRSLKNVCKALHLPQQKDNAGHKVMLKMCKPRKAKKSDKEEFADWEDRIFWHENPDEFEVLCRYCITDVDSEHGVSQYLYDLSDFELKIFQLDQAINNRGVGIDTESVAKLIARVKEAQNKMLLEVQTITKGRLTSTSQTIELKKLLNEQGVDVKDVTAPTVAHALETVGLPPLAKRLLEIRQAMSKSSTAKLDAMLRATGKDGRARGLLLYAGARTLRWSGRLVQPQNLPRNTFHAKDIESIVDLDNEMIEMLYGDVPEVASKCLRGMFVAGEGNEFICGDLKSIEARVLAWIAGEEEVLEQYRAGKDIYMVNAENIYDVPYDQVTKDQRFVGKVAELSLGYQGHVGAFIPMAKQYGVEIESDRAKEIISAWRASRPMTVAFWKGVENAALLAVKTGQPQEYGRIQFGIRGNFLHYRLPNGELRAYAHPGTMVKSTPYGVSKEVITFWGVASDNDKVDRGDKSWGMISTYGGKITENCFCRYTPVITKDGLKPIYKITPNDDIWDGVEWVKSLGAKKIGVKETIKWLGIRVTETHKILVGSLWKKVIDLEGRCSLEALESGLNLVNLRLLFLVLGTTVTQFVSAHAERIIESVQGLFSGAKLCDVDLAGIPPQGKNNLSSQMLSKTIYLDPNGSIGILGSSQDAITKNAQRISTTGEEASRCTPNGKIIEKSSLSILKHLITGTLRALISTVLIMIRDTFLVILRCPQERKTVITEDPQSGLFTKVIKCHSKLFGIIIALFGKAPKLLEIIGIEDAHGKRSQNDTKKHIEVYDIINCGPRNRFAIMTNRGPVIAHNCVQSISRDIIAECMLRLEEAGYKTVMSVHDEVISEVPIKDNRSLEEYRKIMSVVPTWAKGLPLDAEVFRSKRYRK